MNFTYHKFVHIFSELLNITNFHILKIDKHATGHKKNTGYCMFGISEYEAE